jgi:hypothetical protein
MKKSILKIANKKFKNFIKKYDGFINVVVDDWRGYRFVFDTEDVKKCKNDCKNCKLYQLLKNEKPGIFDAGLHPANAEDKKLFGNQRYLNCKTLKQYRDAYCNFILKKITTKKELNDELKLVKEFSIIYSRRGNKKAKERTTKNSIISKSKTVKII